MATSTHCTIVHVKIRDEHYGLHLFKRTITGRTYDDAAERVRKAEMCTALKFVKLNFICIEYDGISGGRRAGGGCLKPVRSSE